MNSYSDKYVAALHAEINRLTNGCEAAIEALRPFVKRDHDPDKGWVLLMIATNDYQTARQFVVAHDEHRRIDDDVLMNEAKHD